MSDAKLVAIHQPNFLPWLGWWDKLVRADVFVLLDDVQFQKKGGNWANRVRVLVNHQPVWLTVPVSRGYHGVRAIRDIEIDEATSWRQRMQRTLKMSYARAGAYEEVGPLIAGLISHTEGNLGTFNEVILRTLAARLGLGDERLVRSSSHPTEGEATERLIEIVRRVEGTAYLSGGGAAGYQDESAFERAGIELVHQEFKSRPYRQRGTGEFVPGLSIVDPLMNLGFDGTRALLGTDN